jgi:hypothetical protein
MGGIPVNRTEADFEAWRDQRDWTVEKYRRFPRRKRAKAYTIIQAAGRRAEPN